MPARYDSKERMYLIPPRGHRVPSAASLRGAAPLRLRIRAAPVLRSQESSSDCVCGLKFPRRAAISHREHRTYSIVFFGVVLNEIHESVLSAIHVAFSCRLVAFPHTVTLQQCTAIAGAAFTASWRAKCVSSTYHSPQFTRAPGASSTRYARPQHPRQPLPIARAAVITSPPAATVSSASLNSARSQLLSGTGSTTRSRDCLLVAHAACIKRSAPRSSAPALPHPVSFRAPRAALRVAVSPLCGGEPREDSPLSPPTASPDYSNRRPILPFSLESHSSASA
ncbi:hypothetical protein B0H13DRAFT_2320815 [Mycena leptocephala]|nr:hypothetical protein B0H13DRAFT_2320815 [Mycena leptocephala]